MSGGSELRLTPAAAGVAVLAAFTWSVWATTGSRVSLFVSVAALAMAVPDVVWAGVATRRVRLTIEANPGEATVGDTLRIPVTVGGYRRFLRLSAPHLAPRPVGVEAPVTVPLAGPAPTRQVLTALEVEVVSPGLAGLVAFARRRPVPLARPLYVGPRPEPAAEPFRELFRTWGEGEARPSTAGELVRGVRPYQPGDPRRRVHWRASARTGELVVKEVDEVGAPRLVLALDMGGGGRGGERAAGRAAWYALEGLRRGYQVTLATVERAAGGVTSEVTAPSEVVRRLAAASTGTPSLPVVAGAGVLLVSDRGDSWH